MGIPVHYVDASFVDPSGIPMGNCPASVDMETGVIFINKSVWDRYDRFEKNFIICHELGHYVLDTDSEYEADAYALKHVYKTAPRSLKRALLALCKIRIVDYKRLDKLYEEALKLDASDGNVNAVMELEQINYFNKPQKSNIMTRETANENFLSKRQKNNVVRIVRRADGDGNKKSHKRNGLMLGDLYFSFTNILLMLIVLILLFKK